VVAAEVDVTPTDNWNEILRSLLELARKLERLIAREAEESAGATSVTMGVAVAAEGPEGGARRRAGGE
jgi:hypothetical protein